MYFTSKLAVIKFQGNCYGWTWLLLLPYRSCCCWGSEDDATNFLHHIGWPVTGTQKKIPIDLSDDKNFFVKSFFIPKNRLYPRFLENKNKPTNNTNFCPFPELSVSSSSSSWHWVDFSYISSIMLSRNLTLLKIGLGDLIMHHLIRPWQPLSLPKSTVSQNSYQILQFIEVVLWYRIGGRQPAKSMI